MKVIFDERQLEHDPELYFRRGRFIPHPEQPQRAILLRDALMAAGHERAHPDDYGLDPVYAVHDRGYVDFCMSAWPAWTEATGATDPAVPNYHTSRREARVPQGVIGKLGYYSTDTSCPFVEGTAPAIYWSAQTAIEAAERIRTGAERHIYALCRPPGHHAYIDATMGFCFFNKPLSPRSTCARPSAALPCSISTRTPAMAHRISSTSAVTCFMCRSIRTRAITRPST